MKLTDSKIKGLRPTGKLYRVADGKGLALEVSPTGAKLWRYRFRLHGKANMLALGAYPTVTLSDARKKRDEAAELVAKGVNPAHHRKAQELNTFRSIAEEYLADQAEVWTPRTLKQRRALFEAKIYPALGDRPINDISSADILRILQGIEATAPTMAAFSRQVIGAVFRKAICTLRAESDPSAPLRGALKPRNVKHHPILPTAEIPGFFERLEAYTGYPTTRAAAELLWLTTVRTVELVAARWDEIDLEAEVWTIPAERMKMRRDHVVPLVPRAVEILRSIEPLTRRTGWVFPNRDDSTKPASAGLLLRMWRQLGYKEFSPHGVRGTFSTWAHDSGYRSEIIEAQLNHADRNVTRSSYNRSAYLQQRREMLEAWAAYLDGLKDGVKIVPIRKKA
ncbi:integrase arm-type DNA-binding domain-containing protein [Methylocaldum sp. 14B]|uniref:tyrosine-type recombinase/integrase n=1 Tax=Methylocaldum sp. 14B TaxID=1912213 RepID=UPI00098A18B7|nr:integrase arm-type DNA-binding domain-containing protein [Methylocaldum sp. 14B]